MAGRRQHILRPGGPLTFAGLPCHAGHAVPAAARTTAGR